MMLDATCPQPPACTRLLSPSSMLSLPAHPSLLLGPSVGCPLPHGSLQALLHSHFCFILLCLLTSSAHPPPKWSRAKSVCWVAQPALGQLRQAKLHVCWACSPDFLNTSGLHETPDGCKRALTFSAASQPGAAQEWLLRQGAEALASAPSKQNPGSIFVTWPKPPWDLPQVAWRQGEGSRKGAHLHVFSPPCCCHTLPDLLTEAAGLPVATGIARASSFGASSGAGIEASKNAEGGDWGDSPGQARPAQPSSCVAATQLLGLEVAGGGGRTSGWRCGNSKARAKGGQGVPPGGPERTSNHVTSRGSAASPGLWMQDHECQGGRGGQRCAGPTPLQSRCTPCPEIPRGHSHTAGRGSRTLQGAARSVERGEMLESAHQGG